MFNFEVFDSIDGAEATWRAFEEHGLVLPYQTIDWITAWAGTSSASGIAPTPVSVRAADGEPLLFLPLGRQPLSWRGVSIDVITWLGESLADQQAPLLTARATSLSDHEVRRLLAELAESLRGDLLDLSRQPTVVRGEPNPFCLPGSVHHATVRATRVGDDWAALFASRIGKAGRKSSRQKRRRLEELGELRFGFVNPDDPEFELAFDSMVGQKRARYAQTGRSDFFADPTMIDFYRNVTLRRPDQVRFATCTLDGQVIATDWGVQSGTTYHGMMPTFDLEWQRYSPGRLLMEWVLEWSCDNDVEIYDFSIGNEAYKEQWADLSTALHRDRIPLSLRGRAAVAPGQTKRRIKGLRDRIDGRNRA